ncbi:uncharacterized protein LOC117802191 [Ailuropoda melanoleuca]|uniref:uncharacterized protein LOC117802191 n=1 Tax=Ailuropoda melanoleuca TaxID=9646 RepID=UPI0014946147|nr:uncharacterized protein LOC117802191 [Ailuropoda melanoleuca]
MQGHLGDGRRRPGDMELAGSHTNGPRVGLENSRRGKGGLSAPRRQDRGPAATAAPGGGSGSRAQAARPPGAHARGRWAWPGGAGTRARSAPALRGRPRAGRGQGLPEPVPQEPPARDLASPDCEFVVTWTVWEMGRRVYSASSASTLRGKLRPEEALTRGAPLPRLRLRGTVYKCSRNYVKFSYLLKLLSSKLRFTLKRLKLSIGEVPQLAFMRSQQQQSL